MSDQVFGEIGGKLIVFEKGAEVPLPTAWRMKAENAACKRIYNGRIEFVDGAIAVVRVVTRSATRFKTAQSKLIRLAIQDIVQEMHARRAQRE